jgi:hypothetical protein
MARFVLVASAIAFAGIGAAFLVCPEAMAEHVGLSLARAIADNDVRAVYGGLQIGIGAFLATCAARPAWFRPGLVAQLFLFGGLALARVVSLFAAGFPGQLGAALHAAEIVAFVFGLVALRRLRAAG